MSIKFAEYLSSVEGKLFINGAYVSSNGGKEFDVFNPATEEVIGKGVAATVEDVDAAAKAAREAFDNGPWRTMSAWERANILFKFADLIDANSEWLGYH